MPLETGFNQPMYKVLLVCTGNTCRTPMAEGILKALLTAQGISNIQVESAGVGAVDKMPATHFAVDVARHWGIDISGHRARQINRTIVDEADLILAMSPEHVMSITRKNPDAAKKTYLIKAFPEAYAPSQEGVADPIGGTLNDYHQTFLELDEILRRIIKKIIELSDPLKKGI
jgi:protein-tyrosine-phosphatase